MMFHLPPQKYTYMLKAAGGAYVVEGRSSIDYEAGDDIGICDTDTSTQQ